MNYLWRGHMVSTWGWSLLAESDLWLMASEKMETEVTKPCQQLVSLEEDLKPQIRLQPGWHLDFSLVKPWPKDSINLYPDFWYAVTVRQ